MVNLMMVFYLRDAWLEDCSSYIYSDQIYIAPSGVQKERIQPSDLFVCDINGTDIEVPLPRYL